MLKSHIFISYRREWQYETDYSEEAGAALREAYGLLAHTTSDSQTTPWSNVHQTLRAIATQRMARPQYRNLCFLMGMAQASLDQPAEALAWLENSCDLSVELEDPAAIAEIAFLCGCLARNQLHLSTATHYFEVSLAAFQQIPEVEQSENVDTAFGIWIQLAFGAFYQAHFDETTSYLEKARQLFPHSSSQAQSRADIEWIEALLNRWRGHSELALSQALACAEVIAQQASPPSAARAKLLVAETALDCAESMGLGSEMQRASRLYITLATPYVQDALGLARSVQDSGGLGLALLAETRLSRLEGRDSPRVATIEHVFDVARQIGDIALLTQAHTALGDEFRFAGEKEAALACYRESLTALEPSDISALGVWPRRAIQFLVNAHDD